MLHGIMKYRTTKETLCWYIRSRSKAPGAMGYWQAVMLGRSRCRPKLNPPPTHPRHSSHKAHMDPSSPPPRLSSVAARSKFSQGFPSSARRRAGRARGTFRSKSLSPHLPSQRHSIGVRSEPAPEGHPQSCVQRSLFQPGRSQSTPAPQKAN